MITITSIEGNRQRLDGGSMFGNAPRAVWEKWTPPDEQGRIELACRCFLVQWNNLNILIETGIGAFFEPKMSARFGVQTPERHILREELDRHGVKPSDINYVVLSHLHFDHAGGLLPTYSEMNAGDEGLIFPNAHFVVGTEAWKRAQTPHSRDRASYIPGLTEKLEATGRLHLVESNGSFPKPLDEILDFIVSDGHTPGQILTKIKGKKRQALFTGDLIPGSHWVHLPITMGYDRFPEAVIDEKAVVYEKAVPEEWILLFTHDDQVSGASVQKGEKGKIEPKETFRTFDSFPLG